MFTRILTHIARLVALLTCLQSTLQVFAQGGLPGRHVDTIVSIQNEQKRLALTVATAELIEKVNNAISMVEPGHLNGEQLTLFALRDLFWRLESDSDELLALHKELISSSGQYRTVVLDNAKKLDKLVRKYRARAKTERFAGIADACTLLARIFELNANRYRLQAEEIPSAHEAIEENLEFVKHLQRFFGEGADDIDELEEDSTANVAQFLIVLKAYKESFKAVKAELERFRDTLEKTDTLEPAPKQNDQAAFDFKTFFGPKQTPVAPETLAVVAPLKGSSLAELREAGVFAAGREGDKATYQLLQKRGVKFDTKKQKTLAHVRQVKTAVVNHADALAAAGILRR